MSFFFFGEGANISQLPFGDIIVPFLARGPVSLHEVICSGKPVSTEQTARCQKIKTNRGVWARLGLNGFGC